MDWLALTMNGMKRVAMVFAICMMPDVVLADGIVRVDIELRPMVNVKNDVVTVGDVADLRADSLQAIQRLSSLYLGRAPCFGKPVTLERDVIIRWVKSRLPDLVSQLNWSGSSQVVVSCLAQELQPDRIVSVGENYLREWLSTRSERAEVRLIRAPKGLFVPPGDIEFKLHPYAQNTQLHKRMTVWVELWSSQRFIRLVPVDFEVSAYKHALAMVETVPRNEAVTMKNLAKTEIDVAAGVRDVIDSEQHFNALPSEVRTKVTLKKGEVLSTHQIEVKPMALQGHSAILIANEGAIQIESKVEVLQDGVMGQVIAVRQKNSQDVLKAKVIGVGKVELSL